VNTFSGTASYLSELSKSLGSFCKSRWMRHCYKVVQIGHTSSLYSSPWFNLIIRMLFPQSVNSRASRPLRHLTSPFLTPNKYYLIFFSFSVSWCQLATPTPAPRLK